MNNAGIHGLARLYLSGVQDVRADHGTKGEKMKIVKVEVQCPCCRQVIKTDLSPESVKENGRSVVVAQTVTQEDQERRLIWIEYEP